MVLRPFLRLVLFCFIFHGLVIDFGLEIGFRLRRLVGGILFDHGHQVDLAFTDKTLAWHKGLLGLAHLGHVVDFLFTAFLDQIYIFGSVEFVLLKLGKPIRRRKSGLLHIREPAHLQRTFGGGVVNRLSE